MGAMTNEEVLRTEVPWASFQSAGILSKEQLEMIYSLDKQEPKTQVAQFHARGTMLVSLFVDILSGINKVRHPSRRTLRLASRHLLWARAAPLATTA